MRLRDKEILTKEEFDLLINSLGGAWVYKRYEDGKTIVEIYDSSNFSTTHQLIEEGEVPEVTEESDVESHNYYTLRIDLSDAPGADIVIDNNTYEAKDLELVFEEGYTVEYLIQLAGYEIISGSVVMDQDKDITKSLKWKKLKK